MMNQYETGGLVEGEAQSFKVCDNKLSVEIGVVPVAGSKGYKVAKVDCPRLPFYGKKVADQILHIEKVHPEDLGKEVEKRLKAFAEELDLNVTPVYKINKDPQLTPLRDEVYGGGRYFNIFVDFGSTNAKCLITRCDEKGTNCGFEVIPEMILTAEICAKWGIRYDKELAYTYNKDDFYEWMSSAVLTFVRRVQNDRKEYAVNVYWSFPRLVADDDMPKVGSIDFSAISKYVTDRLKEYGLRGKFVLMSEADALKSMFKNRVLHIAMASEREVQTNKREEEEAKRHNKEEDDRERRNQAAKSRAHEKYEKELREWNEEHSGMFGRLRGLFSSKPKEEHISSYEKKYIEVVKDRLNELKDFRNTGVSPEMPFGMLLLDAGGSTLDYCYLPEGDKGNKTLSGSYLAGGRQVTEILMKLLCSDDFDEAERRKTKALCSATYENPKLREATVRVYDKCLRDLATKIALKDGCVCVVCSGLAMRNLSLRKLVRDRLHLVNDQKLIWSEDIATMARYAGHTKEKYPDIAEFNLIVRQLQEERQPSPAFDIIGGLFFSSKEDL